ncbi:MAG TPA: PH domain-containing protein [Thermoanaerobaculia bacterium]|nr:PH domain-containing protein [Thermoanaerobaculia bacterium]
MERATTRPAEVTVWRGTPSPLVNLPLDLLLLLAAVLATAGLLWLRGRDGGGTVRDAAAVIPWLIVAVWAVCLLVGLVAHVKLRATKYTITSERLRVTTGLLSTDTDDVELRRVRDLPVRCPLFLRLAGLGDVVVVSTDRTNPVVTLHAVPRPHDLQGTLRRLVEEQVVRHGVGEIDVT